MSLAHPWSQKILLSRQKETPGELASRGFQFGLEGFYGTILVCPIYSLLPLGNAFLEEGHNPLPTAFPAVFDRFSTS